LFASRPTSRGGVGPIVQPQAQGPPIKRCCHPLARHTTFSQGSSIVNVAESRSDGDDFSRSIGKACFLFHVSHHSLDTTDQSTCSKRQKTAKDGCRICSRHWVRRLFPHRQRIFKPMHFLSLLLFIVSLCPRVRCVTNWQFPCQGHIAIFRIMDRVATFKPSVEYLPCAFPRLGIAAA
jgi:hypothetical protein